MTEVIELDSRRREPRPDCRDCMYGMGVTSGTYCVLFSEVILTEAVTAPLCDEFERL